jgi:hypothetical protein
VNRVQSKKCRPTREELTGHCGKMHSLELYDIYTAPNTIQVIYVRRNEMGWACDMCNEGQSAYRNLFETSERNRPFGKPRLKLDDNIKMDLKETGREEVELLMRGGCTHGYTILTQAMSS